ncbi:MAG: hypothetical protein Q4E58_12570 [Prevotellaceae bacterium]|jgi:hypothetical protein|nr:hypothetical protein [Prevotellaceae bacterium]
MNMENIKNITPENFDDVFIDEIEIRQIDKFVCAEMGRQIHRYIKGMRGTKTMMENFEKAISTLSVPEKEVAIARYIDLNRKVLSGLDFKIILARSIANYCDTFDYMLTMINDKRRMAFYLDRIKSKYVRYHVVYEENGKYGMKDYEGNVIVKPEYDFLRTCYVYVDDLVMMPVIAEKDGKLGLILPDGINTVVADFIYDDIYLRDEYPYFEAKKGRKKVLLNEKGEECSI